MSNKVDTKKIILCGFGIVGQGLLHIIQSSKATNTKLEVIAVLDRSYHKKKDILKDIHATDDFQTLITSKSNDPNNKNGKSYLEQADLVVELIGGVDLALYIIRTCLENKIPVVTANKALLAEHGYALFHKSEKYKTPIYYEAAITGAIPIVENLHTYFSHDTILQISGILNGTSNFILSKMSQSLKSFEEILKEAQEKGLAEADPILDVQGIDAAQKLALLAQLISNKWVEYHKISCKGISNIDSLDLISAKQFDLRCKLIASLEFSDDNKKMFLNVEPTFIAKEHSLYNVELENNAIFIHTKTSGSHLFVGKGAGSLPTAYAAYFNICKHFQKSSFKPVPNQYATVSENSFLKRAFYIRLNVHDHKGVLSNLTDLFTRHQISLAKVRQEELIHQPTENFSNKIDIICITHETTYQCLYNFLDSALKDSSLLTQKPVYYPILS